MDFYAEQDCFKAVETGDSGPSRLSQQGESNVVPVDFYYVIPDGKLVVGGVFLNSPLTNLSAPAFL